MLFGHVLTDGFGSRPGSQPGSFSTVNLSLENGNGMFEKKVRAETLGSLVDDEFVIGEEDDDEYVLEHMVTEGECYGDPGVGGSTMQ